jgi:hypothetical protein
VLFQTICHPTFYVLPSRVFLAAESVLVAEPEVFALVFPAADLFPEVVVSVVQPEVVSAVDFEVSELGVVFVPVASVAEPEVVSAAVVFVVGPEIVFVGPFSIVHVSGPQGSVHIHIVFAVSIPVSVVVKGVDIFRRPIFFVFPNIDYCPSLSSFVEDVDKESVGTPTDAHANDGPCSSPSNRSLRHNKRLGYNCNKPKPDHNNVNDTSAHPMDATTSHHRKRCLHRYRE